MFGKVSGERVAPYTEIKTANNTMLIEDNPNIGPPSMNNLQAEAA